jgi:hypothetical protein
MNNTSMRTADRLTHLKILGVSLFAAFVVIGVGLAASPSLNLSTQLEAKIPVLKAGKPVIWTINEGSLIR